MAVDSPDQTTHIRDTQLPATIIVDRSEATKEELDIAFATEVLIRGFISDRQLASAVANWNLHGNLSLADHLLNTRLISPAQRAEVEALAVARLNNVNQDHTIGKHGVGSESATKSILGHLDESGRVAKVLGISLATSVVHGDEDREQTARYELIRKLGQGGLGAVWLAKDVNLQRYVALKEIRNPEQASHASLNRFRREAEITGRLEHPGIVPVYQLGEDLTTGRLFYTMRFLGKQTLQDAICEYHERRNEGADSPMILRNLLTAFVSVCQAIGHAHSRKVIHRDLKPENIAIDNFGQVIVIDWGLAKVLDNVGPNDTFVDMLGSGLDDSRRTIAGQVLGSPLYMAPEQASGRIDEIDERTDVFGLGAILFAILSGSAPHEGTWGGSGNANARDILTSISTKPTPRAREVNPDVDPALDAICTKAMAKRSYNRYESATELAEDIQRWMAGEPVEPYREAIMQRISRWTKYHRRLSQLIALGILVATIGGATLAIASRQNYLAAQEARFEELRADGREIEVQLLYFAEELGKDAQFMSRLPPIQGIINARSNLSDDEDEEVWCGRLETIYEGLLRANPDYLAVAYLAVNQEGATETVRVERRANDRAYIRRVPQSRLSTLKLNPTLETVLGMEPGDVKFSVAKILDGRPGSKVHRLTSAIPVYDDVSGNVFGFVTIEADLSSRVELILDELGDRIGELYLIDPVGQILVSSSPSSGVQIEPGNQSLADLVPEAADFKPTEPNPELVEHGLRLLARSVRLDEADQRCNLGLVQRLSSND